ncbi:hypothetical protein B0J14DRAFT_485267 [Halenospora varia]|nr:hypothetical protein B0J14DRAFT_485267 [Halenospora varia]
MSAITLDQTKIAGVFIPPELGYLLPTSYNGSINANFIDTTTRNTSINALLLAARNATFYVYDQEFYSILGPSPATRIITYGTPDTSHEAGVWLPDRNEIWFSSWIDLGAHQMSILDLNTYTITPANITYPFPGSPNLLGGDYFNGTLFFTEAGSKNASLPPAIYSVDPSTGVASIVLNTYYGVHLNTIDDLFWLSPNTSAGSTSCTHSGPALFFSSLDLGANGEPQYSDAVLPNGVFRYTPSTKSLQQVISRGDILAPNGLRASPEGKYLYVTDSAVLPLSGPGANSWGQPAIYRFELDEDCFPVNKRLFSLPRSGIANTITIDREGRVWTAESNGVVVRDGRGRELGAFNDETLRNTRDGNSQFALAGDKLVVFSGERVQVIQLGQNVTTPAGLI